MLNVVWTCSIFKKFRYGELSKHLLGKDLNVPEVWRIHESPADIFIFISEHRNQKEVQGAWLLNIIPQNPGCATYNQQG